MSAPVASRDGTVAVMLEAAGPAAPRPPARCTRALAPRCWRSTTRRCPRSTGICCRDATLAQDLPAAVTAARRTAGAAAGAEGSDPRHAQLITDRSCCRDRQLSMPGNRRAPARLLIEPDRVFHPLTRQITAVGAQMPLKVQQGDQDPTRSSMTTRCSWDPAGRTPDPRKATSNSSGGFLSRDLGRAHDESMHPTSCRSMVMV